MATGTHTHTRIYTHTHTLAYTHTRTHIIYTYTHTRTLTQHGNWDDSMWSSYTQTHTRITHTHGKHAHAHTHSLAHTHAATPLIARVLEFVICACRVPASRPAAREVLFCQVVLAKRGLDRGQQHGTTRPLCALTGVHRYSRTIRTSLRAKTY